MGSVAERWDVKSGDGGSIAVWVEGEGPPLVLMHGSVSDHTMFAPLVGDVRDEFTIFAMDRRASAPVGMTPITLPSANSATLLRWWMQWHERIADRRAYLEC
jgi:pimeloyl-ACP methyl ester carboxylesterase